MDTSPNPPPPSGVDVAAPTVEKAAEGRGPEAATGNERKMVCYTRKVLLKLSESPLCKCPTGMKPLKEWYGDYEAPPSPAKQSSSRSGNTHHADHSSPTKDGPSAPSSNAASLAATGGAGAGAGPLGRGPPPARSPFANFGRFSSDEGASMLQQPPNERAGGAKGRRIGDRERDSAPHLHDRRRADEAAAGEKDGDKAQWQVQGGRRPADRYTPNYADQPRGGRDRDRRPNGGPEEWRRVEGGKAARRTEWDHPRDRSRERDASRRWNDRGHRPGDEGDDATLGRHDHDAKRGGATGGTTGPKGRSKDAWDTGEGKWEAPSGGAGAAGSGGADAIQAWKAEMKALEAKQRGEPVPVPSAAPPPAVEETKADRTAEKAVKPDPSVLAVRGDPSIVTIDDIEPGKPSPFASIGSPPPGLAPPMDALAAGGAKAPSRGSRFAKFFDSNRDSPKSQPAPEGEAKPAKAESVDPDGMARVLSMLQMSSKPAVAPEPRPAGDPPLLRPQPSRLGLQQNLSSPPDPAFSGPPPGLGGGHTKAQASIDRAVLGPHPSGSGNSLGVFSAQSSTGLPFPAATTGAAGQQPSPTQQREGSKMHFMRQASTSFGPSSSIPPPIQSSMPGFSTGPAPPPGLGGPPSAHHMIPSPQMAGFGMPPLPPMGGYPGSSPPVQPGFQPMPGLGPPGLHSPDARIPSLPRSPLPSGQQGQPPAAHFGPPPPGMPPFGAGPPPPPFFSQGPAGPGFMPPLPPPGMGFQPPPAVPTGQGHGQQQIDLLALLNGRPTG